jgi:hypothetical protein
MESPRDTFSPAALVSMALRKMSPEPFCDMKSVASTPSGISHMAFSSEDMNRWTAIEFLETLLPAVVTEVLLLPNVGSLKAALAPPVKANAVIRLRDSLIVAYKGLKDNLFEFLVA